jgi:hypothetical protein
VEGVAAARPPSEPQPRQALEQDRRGDAHFEPRERRADAEVDPGSNDKCGLGSRFGGKASGSRKRSASRLAASSRSPISSPFLKRTFRDLGVLERVAGEEMERRVQAQKLLDRRRRRFRVGKDRLRVGPVFENRLRRVADGVDRRLVPGVEQKDAGRDELVLAKLALLALGDEKLADEIVASVDAARA